MTTSAVGEWRVEPSGRDTARDASRGGRGSGKNRKQSSRAPPRSNTRSWLGGDRSSFFLFWPASDAQEISDAPLVCMLGMGGVGSVIGRRRGLLAALRSRRASRARWWLSSSGEKMKPSFFSRRHTPNGHLKERKKKKSPLLSRPTPTTVDTHNAAGAAGGAAAAGHLPTIQLRREPFEFGLLPASYLLPRVETAAALVPIQKRLLAVVRT